MLIAVIAPKYSNESIDDRDKPIELDRREITSLVQ